MAEPDDDDKIINLSIRPAVAQGPAPGEAVATAAAVAEVRPIRRGGGGGTAGAPPGFDTGAPHHSDIGMSDVFIERYGEDVRYVRQWKEWLRWTGQHRWERDHKSTVENDARELCKSTAGQALDNKARHGLSAQKKVGAVMWLARTYERVAATPGEFDRHPWLLNTPGGVVDLRTGEARPAERADMLTKLTNCAPTPAGMPSEAPKFQAFLRRIQPDPEIRAFLQRFFGYALTGITTEHAFAIFYGTGANGKSVLLSTVAHVMGDYAMTAPTEVFTAGPADRHSTEIARLKGARLVTAQETEQGRRLAEARVKLLTGGDKVTARFMRQDDFEYVPELKLVISGNNRPKLQSTDEAMRRRLLLVPFGETIPMAERDEGLALALRDEGAAILDWLIEGAVDWQRYGLSPPAAVRVATDDYLAAEDFMGQWLETSTIADPQAWTGTRELYADWRAFCEDRGEQPRGEKWFSSALEARPGSVKQRNSRTGNQGFAGLALRVMGA